jgi:hypothetical protein
MTWRGKELLVVYRPGDPYSFWWAWDAATWELSWRYINLEDPWQRTSIGFDSHDRDLDLDAMGTDGEWRWKDEDEVAWRVANGQYTQAVADEVRATGERALEQVLRRVPPLDRPWAEWRPDRSWAMPTLAPDWKELVPKRR